MTRLWPVGEPVEVTLGADGLPSRFLWRGRWRAVASIANRWRVRSSWWQPAADAHREYVKLTTADGLLCALYRDLRDDTWHLVRLYD
jgi:hypothetical protein